jgi:hypothetical protein
MLTDLLLFVLLFTGVIVLGGAAAFGIWLAVSAHDRERVRRAWLELETLRASRRIHNLSSQAFQAMLDAAREQQHRDGAE